MIPPFSDLDLKALKTMTHGLVAACGGPDAAADALSIASGAKVHEVYVSRWATQTDMKRFMPVQHIVGLEIAAGRPIVSNWMVGRLARDGSACPGEMQTPDVLRLMQCTAILNGVVSEAFADGRADSAERAAIREKTAAMRALLDELDRKNAQP